MTLLVAFNLAIKDRINKFNVISKPMENFLKHVLRRFAFWNNRVQNKEPKRKSLEQPNNKQLKGNRTQDEQPRTLRFAIKYFWRFAKIL
jgi:hypothetical protein